MRKSCRFILWDELSVVKSVIWVVFGKQRLIIVMRSLPLQLAMGRKLDMFIALSHYTLIANPIIPKNPKIFVPHQFFVKFWSKKADKMRNICVGHLKIRKCIEMTKFVLKTDFNAIFC